MTSTRRAARHNVAFGSLVAAGMAQFVPSVLVLGQWVPDALPFPRTLPGGLCRWRGPAVPKVALTFDDGPSPDTTPAR